MTEMAIDDLEQRLFGNFVVEHWTWVDIEGRAIITSIATGCRQDFDLAAETSLPNRQLENWHELPAAPTCTVRPETKMHPILTRSW